MEFRRRLAQGVGVVAVAGAAGGVLSYGAVRDRERHTARCSDRGYPPRPPFYPFWFKWMLHGHDIPSVRRGFEVYQKVCANCHSMVELSFRHLINEVYPEKRVKQIAAQYDVFDGPNQEGEIFVRPGIWTDSFPRPYPNDDAARYANGGALPPDLSGIVAGMHGNADYIFSLLTGYRDPPEGMPMNPGQYYNTYTEGGIIAMPPPLSDGIIEYEDGTPATVSQMAKDVAQFLTWATEPATDERKLIGIKAASAAFIGGLFSYTYCRMIYIQYRTRRIDFVKPVFT
ncbi:unnamed protein product [Vitrella brassicaformis CCMP3155]|uniref:Cytochrome c domain-containing protein n=2 Tax=Vitrella brassicaformis TaxID=1169539 RepID=A0A0G4FWP7_VITBC|nr:unnamed protein product [Vitrella brassicaformis CCMP3155]|mmetsp:Transcript_38385/g.96153  ORF Transcript_38385/g.96153 Transcript_38385/m.96153 type:complete len:285 (+) Transcript_38385:97-951(+)|eukprot:CEM19644.1 unnamed protein product [Vitrella brassicaformis CCMP3155]